jgi:glycerol kinase
LFDVPEALLPQVRDCAGDFGTTELFGRPIRILGIAGDQQAAMVGQGCFAPGMVKSTYGTGCFALINTADQPVASKNRLLTTIAYQLGGRRTYALEGAIFVAGAAVQWLRDALKVIGAAPDVNALAAAADPAEQVYLVPAFVGLGAPWWDANSRRSAIRPATCSRRCRPIGRRRGRTRCCGSMAAWRRVTSPCSSSPTFWPRRSIVRA